VRWLVGAGLALLALVCGGGCESGDSPAGAGAAGEGSSTGGTTNDGCPADPVPCSCSATSCSNEHTICPLSIGTCPPTLAEVLEPDQWPPNGTWAATLDECDGGIRHLGVSYFEAGYSAAFDASGKLIYEEEFPCYRVLCGERPELTNCRSCRLSPVEAFPYESRPEGGGGEGGESPVGTIPPCHVDRNGALVVPKG
jgi:hypothetical protein